MKASDDIDVKQVLHNHELRISQLESLLAKNKKPINSDQNQRKNLVDHIISLRDSEFFSQSKTSDEVYKKIQETYPCELNRVAVALLRLAKRRQLRKATKNINDKTYQAYVR